MHPLIQACLLLLLTLPAQLSAQTWTETSGNPSGSRYDDIQFLTESIGYACNGSGEVYKTSDGGSVWESLTSIGGYARAVEFIDERVGFVGNLNGGFYRTEDGGRTWTDIRSELIFGDQSDLTVICALDHIGTTVYGSGNFSGPAYFVKSADGGQTWDYTLLDSLANSLTECKFLTEDVGYLAGEKGNDGGVILKTTDGGDTWRRVHLTDTGFSYVWKLDFPAPDLIYGSVERFAPGTEYIVKSTDGGETWVNLPVSDTYLDLQGIGFLTADYGFVGPRNVPAFVTRDGGLTWSQDATAPPNANKILRHNGELFAGGSIISRFQDETVATANFAGRNRPGHTLRVTPNPLASTGQATVHFAAPTRYRIDLLTADGLLVRKLASGYAAPGEMVLDLEVGTLPAGAYLVNLHTNRNNIATRFVKR